MNGILRRVPAWPIYVVGPIPGLLTFWMALNDRLGPDPMQVLEHRLGELALQFMILTLIVTPIRRWTKVSFLKFRRALGIIAFVYVLGHLLTWVILDRQLDFADMINEIVKRPYITIGMIGFLAMVPLAVTSNNLSVRKLGAALWTRIHRLAYVAALAGVAHYLLIAKGWPLEPMIYAAAVILLLSVRAWWKFDRNRGARS